MFYVLLFPVSSSIITDTARSFLSYYSTHSSSMYLSDSSILVYNQSINILNKPSNELFLNVWYYFIDVFVFLN